MSVRILQGDCRQVLATRVTLELTPISLREANAFVEQHHRHSPPTRGCICCVAVAKDLPSLEAIDIIGVAIVGRPIARGNDDGYTAEVLRCCTDGTPNACSMLYGAAWRAARALGYRRLITYTLATEPGASLRAAGLRVVAQVKGRSWSCLSRPRVDTAPHQDKLRWEVAA